MRGHADKLSRSGTERAYRPRMENETISSASAGWLRNAVAWVRGSTPLMTRARHRAEVRALGAVAADLCTAVQQAGEASSLALRQWQDVARQALAERDLVRRQRDDAVAEIDRLRSTVASLVLAGVKGEREGP
ncbi:MAG: hypothetical protein NVS4B3_08550 [Gemmatimonadaceae bacterium]